MIELTKLEEQIAQRDACREDFFYFLNFVKIVEPPSQTSTGGAIPFTIWRHLEEAYAQIISNQRFVWLKSRQIGASWFIAALNIWDVLFKPGFTILLVSKDETASIELLDKSTKILNHLPGFLYKNPPTKSRTEMAFSDIETQIKAFSSTAKGGISFTASRIVCDEWDAQEYASENYANIQPCIDSSGGQFIGIFTRDPWGGEDSLAVSTFRGAMKGENGFKCRFDPYTVRPGRDKEWYDNVKAAQTEQTLKGLTRELYMKKNYPRSIEEALSTIGVLRAFDNEILDDMNNNILPKVKIQEENIDNNIVNIFKPFRMGHYYVAAIDTSHGVGKDYSVTCVMDVKTGEVVADILDRHLKPNDLAWHSYHLLKYYKSPKVFPEDNDWGHEVINTLLELGYKNMGYQSNKKKDGTTEITKSKPGWHTDKKTRPELWNGLTAGINNHQITIYNPDGIRQFYDVVRNERGEMAAKSGGNDDYPVAVGICWARKDSVQTEEFVSESIRTLTF